MGSNASMTDNLERISVTDEIYIEYDSGDSWFAICDEDWSSYDTPGGVTIGLDSIDALIDKLQELKAIHANLFLARSMIGVQFFGLDNDSR